MLLSNQANVKPDLPGQGELDEGTRAFFGRALWALTESKIPFLVGGGYAFACYTGIERHTRDLDIFVRRRDCDRTLQVLSMAGCRTALTFPHWLAKAFCGEEFIDVIFSSGNGIAEVDDGWFEHALEGEILGQRVRLCPLEETIWSRAFVMERERYHGADVAHIIHTCKRQLDWRRLLRRFGPHWRVLLSHCILFGFIYPSKRSYIPDWVMHELAGRLQREMDGPPSEERTCQGPLLSRAEYLVDVEQWGYRDARRLPGGTMSAEEIARWTAAGNERQESDGEREGDGAAGGHR